MNWTADGDIPGYRRITLSELSNEGCINLVEAIVSKAATDWKKGMLLYGPKCSSVRDVERFFLSDYFHTLTGLDGKYIIEELRKETPEELKQDIYMRNEKVKEENRWSSIYQ